MEYLPLFMRLQGQPVLLVGGGAVALRKAQLLKDTGAAIKVVAPVIELGLFRLLGSNHAFYERAFQSTDLDGVCLVIAATDNTPLNKEISRLCKARQLPVNVVDNPELCSFIVPAIVDRDPITIAISTAGVAPSLARILRAKIESVIPIAYGRLARLAERFRYQVKQRVAAKERRLVWDEVLQGAVAEQVLAGNEQAAEQLFNAYLDERERKGNVQRVGEVYLVGAGPGDPELLTFKALRLMQQADIVLYDRLVAEPILQLVRRDAERIYVGKAASVHSIAQSELNQLLLDLARQGKRVLRLKGGDPFIFGRGGEELEALLEHDIPFQIVPGITAASGCASYAGIPLTHRDYAQSVQFVTAHRRVDGQSPDWSRLSQSGQTLVFYMGLNRLVEICSQLIEHGASAALPAALIEQGTTPQQRVITGTLATLPEQADKAQVESPALIVVGEVVKLHAKLNWFQQERVLTSRPLSALETV